MVRDNWNFTANPFEATLTPASFYCGKPQEEVLARLEWICQERQRFAIVVGVEGVGKSHLSTTALRRVSGLGAEAVLLSLRGVPEGEWLPLLLERFPLDYASRCESITNWQKLENRLRENRLMERPTVILVDDIDHAPTDAVAGIERLVNSAEPRFSWTTVVGTATESSVENIPHSLQNLAAMRVHLDPWDTDDVYAFLSTAITRVGGDPAIIPSATADTVARFAGGLPRLVSRLTHLSLAAAAGDSLSHVDSSTVERVWRELYPVNGSHDSITRTDGGHSGRLERLGGRVRAVRKLFE
jgi:type II secretory pathway predicted ATPase ExeA